MTSTPTPGIVSQDDRTAAPFGAPAGGPAWSSSVQLPPYVPPAAPLGAAPAPRSGRSVSVKVGSLSVAGAVLFGVAYVGWNVYRSVDASADVAQAVAETVRDVSDDVQEQIDSATPDVVPPDAPIPGPGGAAPGGTDVLTLAEGDCLTGVTAGTVSDVTVVPCTQPHTHEVYEVTDLPDTPWPGEAAVSAAGDGLCLGAFYGFAGIDYGSSVLLTQTLVPTEGSWEGADDHAVVCLATDPTVPATTGSLAGARR
ncbi:septum formation family protein [Blastococcus sp. SYSU D00695]